MAIKKLPNKNKNIGTTILKKNPRNLMKIDFIWHSSYLNPDQKIKKVGKDKLIFYFFLSFTQSIFCTENILFFSTETI
jgi:hypothetical protein